MVYVKVLSRDTYRRTEENHEVLSLYCRCSRRRLNRTRNEFQSLNMMLRRHISHSFLFPLILIIFLLLPHLTFPLFISSALVLSICIHSLLRHTICTFSYSCPSKLPPPVPPPLSVPCLSHSSSQPFSPSSLHPSNSLYLLFFITIAVRFKTSARLVDKVFHPERTSDPTGQQIKNKYAVGCHVLW